MAWPIGISNIIVALPRCHALRLAMVESSFGGTVAGYMGTRQIFCHRPGSLLDVSCKVCTHIISRHESLCNPRLLIAKAADGEQFQVEC